MRLLDVFLAFPMVLLGLAIVSVLGDGMVNVMLAIVIIELPSWPGSSTPRHP